MTNRKKKLWDILNKYGFSEWRKTRKCLFSDLTALISEHYVAKEEHEKLATATNGLMLTIKELRAKYDELLQQRDELKEALEHIAEYWNRDRNDEAMHNALWEIINTAEAAIKNTETK